MNNSNDFRPEYNRDYVSRVFKNREEADRAYAELEQRGYSKDDVNVLMSDQTRDTHFLDSDADSHLGDKVAENAGKGSMIGGGIGAAVGAASGYIIGRDQDKQDGRVKKKKKKQ